MNDVDLAYFHCRGEGSCVGGDHPEPVLDQRWPLLAWAPGHPVHGSLVFTEDQKATVESIALAACETPDYAVLAARFGTTEAHVNDAISYALKAGFLGGK